MRLSVIIPTWNESSVVGNTVADCLAVGDEVVVADGGSRDGTFAAAVAAGARVLAAPRGRGPQLNAGAAAATGDVLLFVHADTRVPHEARGAIEQALSDGLALGGNFRLQFDPPTLAARLYSEANHWRRRWLGVYYGDSCIFVRRRCFDQLGGFLPVPLFEDYDFCRRLQKMGPTRYIKHVVVHPSSRRFAARPLKTLGIWTALQGLYSCGVPAHRLASWYRAARS